MNIKRLDHLGIVSGVIGDLNIVADIDALLPMYELNEITYGEAVKAMIMNGLAFLTVHYHLPRNFLKMFPLNFFLDKG